MTFPIPGAPTIPAFDNIKVIDEKGFWTPEYRAIMQELFQILQIRVSGEGLVMPSLTAANIAKLTTSANGAMVYDSTNDLAKLNIAGSFKTIQTL
jgi:hypothetical protein